MLPLKAKAEIKKGKFKAEVKYPLVGGAELELGPVSKLIATIKIPFIAAAKFLGVFEFKKKKK